MHDFWMIWCQEHRGCLHFGSEPRSAADYLWVPGQVVSPIWSFHSSFCTNRHPLPHTLPLWLDVRIKWDDCWAAIHFLARKSHSMSLPMELLYILYKSNLSNARLLHSVLNQASEDFRDISWYWQCALQKIQQSSTRIVSARLLLTHPYPVIPGSKPRKPLP